MLITKLQAILNEGEGLKIEFKECKSAINKDVYETVCAFLNRQGGELILGVKDNGIITGIDKDKIEQIKKDFVTAVNNPLKITPSVYLSVEQVEIENKQLLYIYIPQSSQVHKCNGKIFDRNQDGDLNITDKHSLVTGLYMNKHTFFTENRVYPYCKIEDLNLSLFNRVKKLVRIQNNNHFWQELSFMEFLKSEWQDCEVRHVGCSGGHGDGGVDLILITGSDEYLVQVKHHPEWLKRKSSVREGKKSESRSKMLPKLSS